LDKNPHHSDMVEYNTTNTEDFKGIVIDVRVIKFKENMKDLLT